MLALPATWAQAKDQICDHCGSSMTLGHENYICPRCGNARQKALIRWLRERLRRAS